MASEYIEFLSPVSAQVHPVVGTDVYSGISLRGFIDNLSMALGILNEDIEFMPAYPQHVLFYEEHVDRFKPTITWDVKHSAPQQLGGKSSPNADSGTREAKPRLRTIIKSDDDKEYQLFGQQFQTFIKFDIWALTASEAENIARWFQHDFMAHYGHILGSQHVRFYERIRDAELTRINNRLQTRSLIYYVLLEEYTVKAVDLITRIRTKIENS